MADVAIPSGGGGAFVAGTYVGSGEHTSKTISIGFTPSLVLVGWNGMFFADYSAFAAMAMPAYDNMSGIPNKILEIVAGGFWVSGRRNASDRTLHYIAFR